MFSLLGEMDSLDTAASFMEDLLDFSSDIGEEDNGDGRTKNPQQRPHFSLLPFRTPHDDSGAKNLPFPDEFVEEELEWISNKDAFPLVESLVEIMPVNNHPSITSTNHQSPISVLENSSNSSNSRGGGTAMSLSSSLRVPVRARSKRGRKRRSNMLVQQWQRWSRDNSKTTTGKRGAVAKASSTIGRKCQHCEAEKTPQWRAGPMGPKTLCNACGVRYKSGRLCPEYRPARSPTFSSLLHSNSHRTIIEMKKKQLIQETGFEPADTG
ncbi:hypothetical protein Nepgr_031170 [Nepenthes gracilis]|uniref:GATA-type domain-containing protein n=1 Tax=Nepenthes gracilis TaxID=150966 RepID=A0AAD3TIB7_NEPGR|nr:hypothetical protein Nepgr_031170 [Nepenthes gracilis]